MSAKEIAVLIFHYTSSWLVTLLKDSGAPIQVLYISDLTVSFKLINFSFLSSVPEMSISFMCYSV